MARYNFVVDKRFQSLSPGKNQRNDSQSLWQSMQGRGVTHKCGTGQRKRGLGTTEAEITNWGLGVRDAQKTVHATSRSSFKRHVVKTNNGTSVASDCNSSGVNAKLYEGREKSKRAEQHPQRD